MIKMYKESLLVVLFSGGKGSFVSAMLLKDKGFDNVVLYFNDTKIEDPDSYRFINETREYLGFPLIVHSDGRDVFQVFKDVKYMGNTRIDPCSQVLKRDLSKSFRKRFDPKDVRFFTGIGLWEEDRLIKAKPHWSPYSLSSALVDFQIYDDKALADHYSKSSGISLPIMYDYGFSHNNCGGFCVKAGLAHYANLFSVLPDRYMEFERKEEDVYQAVPNARPFLRKTVGGKLRYLTLREFRTEFLEPGFDSSDEPRTTCTSCALI